MKNAWNCFSAIVQDYREAIKWLIFSTHGEGFFLRVKICYFLHRLLRRFLPRSYLPDDWDWDALRSFDFAVGELLSILDFMEKTEFRAKAFKVAKSKIDFEHERGKKSKPDAVAKTVMGESIKLFIDQGSQYIKHMWKKLLKHPSFSSDVIIGLA